MRRFSRHIHLLYVPTLQCNLGCSYCYLGDQTARRTLAADARRATATLERALELFDEAGVLPFNVSLHGGEVTVLPPAVLEALFRIISRHYLDHFDELNALGHRKSSPHLKTNLSTFHKLYDLFERHRVSISASIDLPLTMHARYRTDRRGRPWLQRTLENLRLLGRYPYAKKISATLYHEHLQDIPALISDIRMIHDELGFDMNNFNIMFGFGASLQPADEPLQLKLYEALKAAFTGTELEEGLRRNWFDEFKPTYCTNAFNCGERFYLLQGDGSVWSCVRGQGVEQLYYGNILKQPVEEILANGQRAVSLLHQQQGLDPACRVCEYLSVCHTGCPAVKRVTNSGRSYTCALQKAIYRDNPRSWPALAGEAQAAAAREYLLGMHPAVLLQDEPLLAAASRAAVTLLPAELYQESNTLRELIAADPVLTELYRDDVFLLSINGEQVPLQSQILKARRTIYSLGAQDRLLLHLRKSLLAADCPEPLRNTLYLQLLRDTTVVYGDERRSKQEHLVTHQIFASLLEPDELLGDDFLCADISGLLALSSRYFLKDVANNLLVTTGYLRDYHYWKQKNNAFYHIQAINLPFQNFEFYWDMKV